MSVDFGFAGFVAGFEVSFHKRKGRRGGKE